MTAIVRWSWVLVLSAATTASARGQFTHGNHEPHGSANYNYNPGIFLGYGPAGPYVYSPPLIVVGPGGYFPTATPVPIYGPPTFPIGQGGGGGLRLPMPPGPIAGLGSTPPRRNNPARARELVELGDRSFRAGNLRKAEERFAQAIKADPTLPLPRVHAAQVALTRADYSGAAEHLRAAATVAGPGWLLTAPDIQAVFAEPGDFARQVAKVETHLQATPNDRDAWFVLGVEWFLSGRTRQAGDVFKRLNDRRPDEALAAFLDASAPGPLAPN